MRTKTQKSRELRKRRKTTRRTHRKSKHKETCSIHEKERHRQNTRDTVRKKHDKVRTVHGTGAGRGEEPLCLELSSPREPAPADRHRHCPARNGPLPPWQWRRLAVRACEKRKSRAAQRTNLETQVKTHSKVAEKDENSSKQH